MSQLILRITNKDTVQAVAPRNGETSWLRVKLGGGHQLWVDRDAAETLRKELARVLAEMERVEAEAGSETYR